MLFLTLSCFLAYAVHNGKLSSNQWKSESAHELSELNIEFLWAMSESEWIRQKEERQAATDALLVLMLIQKQ